MIKGWNQSKISHSSIDIVGAGAVGTPVAVGCAFLGIGTINLYDHDTVEETNLNRQFLYTEEDIGKPKVQLLARRLRQMNPHLEIKASRTKVNENYVSKLYADVIAECAGDFKTKSVLNRYAVARKIPLVSGGSDGPNGQLTVYVPDRTPCLNCQQDVDRFAKDRQTVPQPTIITTALNIAGLMLDQIRKIISPLDQYDTPLNGILHYDRYMEKLFYVTPVKKREGCNC